MKITNTQTGPRGINAVGGPVLIEPGQTWEGDVYAREKEHIEKTGWFTVEGSFTANPATAAQTAPAAANSDADKARIAELEDTVKTHEATIAELKKQLPETDVAKMTVPELRAFLAFYDVAFDGTKDKKDDLLGKAKAVEVK